jgi:hypothetical protein
MTLRDTIKSLLKPLLQSVLDWCIVQRDIWGGRQQRYNNILSEERQILQFRKEYEEKIKKEK